MYVQLFTFLHGALLLGFGITLTTAFSGIRLTKKNVLIFAGFFLFSGTLQIAAFLTLSETLVWKLYPLITHLPLILLLRFGYHKPTVAALSSTFTAYLLCQPAKWLGVLAYEITGLMWLEYAARIAGLLVVGHVALCQLTPCLSEIFNKDRRSVCIFGLLPTVYYLFDYTTAVYTDLWLNSDRVVMEFLPLFLAIVYVIFCFVYYKEYEQKADAQRKEQIIRITVEQQAKEISAVKQSEQEIRLLRHDMRLLLSSLAISIENGETETAQEMIASHIARIDGTRLERFCGIETINYVLSDYAAKCSNDCVAFSFDVALENLDVDELLFCSILSNALDNAFNAQKELPADQRKIRLMLKQSGGKLLLSVKNPTARQVTFVNGLPLSEKKGHGYGTQSIRYLTERLGGNCQFSQHQDVFILRVVL